MWHSRDQNADSLIWLFPCAGPLYAFYLWGLCPSWVASAKVASESLLSQTSLKLRWSHVTKTFPIKHTLMRFWPRVVQNQICLRRALKVLLRQQWTMVGFCFPTPVVHSITAWLVGSSLKPSTMSTALGCRALTPCPRQYVSYPRSYDTFHFCLLEWVCLFPVSQEAGLVIRSLDVEHII